MPYAVVFNADLSQVPDKVLVELRISLADIGESISTIPATNVFWVSIDDSLFELTISGWRFAYLIDRHKNELVVVSVQKIERQVG